MGGRPCCFDGVTGVLAIAKDGTEVAAMIDTASGPVAAAVFAIE